MIDSQVEKQELNLYLNRTYYPTGTNGSLTDGMREISKTIELPWKDNQPRISCIPEGTYPVVIYNSPKHGPSLLLKKVPGRSMIEVHSANWAMGKDGTGKTPQLLGCIAPVTQLDTETGGRPGVGWNSGKALEKVEALTFPVIKAGGQVFLHIRKAA
ncbi:hypothetical protein CLV58_109186 [Spirosoma oryzae]|uniref:DUF5675 domain-containing protein n=1 Tax=Spirosoma oryzae TaxID=1469603 RepID=A0A2T0SYJ3_9BACT|nr:DUF5675 family protein [Spirosoma oryzae]PRY38459.1 hypothetical protein CLV58_109186 [Spirosoma oryzae]